MCRYSLLVGGGTEQHVQQNPFQYHHTQHHHHHYAPSPDSHGRQPVLQQALPMSSSLSSGTMHRQTTIDRNQRYHSATSPTCCLPPPQSNVRRVAYV